MSELSSSSATMSALIQFKLGLYTEMVRVSVGNLSYQHAQRLAAEVIQRKVNTVSHTRLRRFDPLPAEKASTEEFKSM